MTLPTMLPGLSRPLVTEWCDAVDAGPWRSLAAGERIAFDNLELLTTLTFAGARTERVRIAPTLVILPMHPVALVAKQLATLDVLTDGRVDVVVGVGGREQDFRCAERPFAHRHQTLDDQVAELRRLWAGGAPHEGAPAVGPAPRQAGGPPILSGSLGPKSLARAARWADGVMGFSLAPDTDDWSATFGAVADAWEAAGRDVAPRQATSFWYSLDPDAEQVLHDYAVRYLRVFGDDAAAGMATLVTAAGPERIATALARLDAAGCDEVYLVPTTIDPGHLTQLAALRP